MNSKSSIGDILLICIIALLLEILAFLLTILFRKKLCKSTLFILLIVEILIFTGTFIFFMCLSFFAV